MERKVILFDLDGTLTDSGEGIINCAVFALEHFGLSVHSREALRSIVGPPLFDTFRRFGVPEARLDEAVVVFRCRYVLRSLIPLKYHFKCSLSSAEMFFLTIFSEFRLQNVKKKIPSL